MLSIRASPAGSQCFAANGVPVWPRGWQLGPQFRKTSQRLFKAVPDCLPAAWASNR